MKLHDLEREARELSAKERAALVLSLMDTLSAPGTAVSDEEVDRRDSELDNGSVQPLGHEEFIRRISEQRGR